MQIGTARSALPPTFARNFHTLFFRLAEEQFVGEAGSEIR
jgi:hypothetical protein